VLGPAVTGEAKVVRTTYRSRAQQLVTAAEKLVTALKTKVTKYLSPRIG
jgi:hypothetical protein